MEIDLPSPAEVLLKAYQLASVQAGPDTAFAERAKALVMIARELREGSRVPEQPSEAAILAAQAAFGTREQSSGWNATTYGDQADGQERWVTPDTHPDITNDQTAILTVEQPMPTPNSRGSIQALVRHDLTERERIGVQRYGTPLQAFNGRDALRDAYEEALDLACYLRQALAEREGTP